MQSYQYLKNDNKRADINRDCAIMRKIPLHTLTKN